MLILFELKLVVLALSGLYSIYVSIIINLRADSNESTHNLWWW
ncbi:hypothetical protein SAMN05444484_11235 [Flavobacterium chilense]|uniref:Uncharacterized protein n=1 Tax=Flavobacterium chilense TaxID=946677 RepID=A0A1M7MD45_9FLAO|nr:hypothetical protein SAMN05444484_11235 [Flavobacterium chilense]